MSAIKLKNAVQGFSLIELMVVIAIVALLAAVAVPAYKQYYNRSSLAEFKQLIGATKTQALEYYNANGVWPVGDDIGVSGSAWSNTMWVNDYALLSSDIYSSGQCDVSYQQVTFSNFNTGGMPVYRLQHRMAEDSSGKIITLCFEESDTIGTLGNLYYGSECDYQDVISFHAACT